MSGFNVQMTRGALLHGRKSVCGHVYDGGGLKVQARMEKPACMGSSKDSVCDMC